MFSLSKTPDWLKRATDIASNMDLVEDRSAEYDNTKSRLEDRQADMESRWGADPAWEKMSDDMKTGMTLAVDAADGTANTGGLFGLATDWNNESNMTIRAGKQKKLAEKAATIVGKKPTSDQQSIDFAGLTFNIANDRYSGDESGKTWARDKAWSFTGQNSLHSAQNSPQSRSYTQSATDEGDMETMATSDMPRKGPSARRGRGGQKMQEANDNIATTAEPPVINMEADRLKNIVENEPAEFEIRSNPDLSGEERIYEFPYQGYQAVTRHDATIREMAHKHSVDEDLIRAVMWAENARGHKFGLNGLADLLGVSDSGLPMNMNNNTGAMLLGKPVSDMGDARNNIEASTIFLKRIGERINKPTPSKVGSIWNASGRENVNPFGAFIQKVYKEKPWLNPKEQWLSPGDNDGP